MLAALIVGSAAAGIATVLAEPLDLPLADERSVQSASFANVQRPSGPTRHTSTRPATSSQSTAPPTTSALPTTTPTTTSQPATSTEKPTDPPPPASTTRPSAPTAPPDVPVDRVIALV